MEPVSCIQSPGCAGNLQITGTSCGWSVLHHVAHQSQSGSADNIEHLLTPGTDVNVPTLQPHSPCEYCADRLNGLPVGVTPLHIACSTGSYDIAHVLLKHGANVDIEDSRGWRPIHYVIHDSRAPDVLRLVLNHGADVLKTVRSHGITLTVISLLLTTDNSPVFRSERGSTATVAILDMLIKSGPKDKLTELDSEGRSPLHIAVETGNTKAVKLLTSIDPRLLTNLDTEPDVNDFLAVQKAPLNTLTFMLARGAYLPDCGFVRIRNDFMAKVDVTQAFYMSVAMVTGY